MSSLATQDGHPPADSHCPVWSTWLVLLIVVDVVDVVDVGTLLPLASEPPVDAGLHSIARDGMQSDVGPNGSLTRSAESVIRRHRLMNPTR
jgi:hypothetical protein